MTENAEVGYYQSVVDDLRVANERKSELIDELRIEQNVLRGLIAKAANYIRLVDEHHLLHENTLAAFDDLADSLNSYLNAKTVNRP